MSGNFVRACCKKIAIECCKISQNKKVADYKKFIDVPK
jgi:hypothetical protein